MADTLKAAIDDLKQAPRTNIKGKGYSTVATRIEVFRKHFGLEYGITTELLTSPEPDLVRVRATIHDPDGRVYATGMGEEDRRMGNINKTSALENCETSAIGRALAAFGLHGGEYATADEVQTAIHQQEQPQQRTTGAKPVTGQYGITALKAKLRELGQDVRNAGDYDELVALLNDSNVQAIMSQCADDLPEWWYGAGGDSVGLQGLVERRKRELAEADDRRREFEPKE
jgi:hypothetical protein